MTCSFCGTAHRSGSDIGKAESPLLGTIIETLETCKLQGSGFAQLAHPQQIFNDPRMRDLMEPEVNCFSGPEWSCGQEGTTVQDLIEWANSGWPLAQSETAQIQWEDGFRDSFVLSETGTDGVDPGAYASGDPFCTFEYAQATNPVPVPVKAIVSMGFGAGIPGETIMKWSQAMSVAMQTVRMAGGQVELSGCVSSGGRAGSTGRMNWLWPIADTRYPMPLAVEAFFAGNPAMNRVMKFAIANTVEAYDGFHRSYIAGQGRPMPIDLFSLPVQWHEARIIPGPRMYEDGFTNLYGEERYGVDETTHEEMVRDILAALGWKVAE